MIVWEIKYVDKPNQYNVFKLIFFNQVNQIIPIYTKKFLNILWEYEFDVIIAQPKNS